MSDKNAWESIKDELRQGLTSEAFQNWVERTEFLNLDEATLRVAVPDEVTKNFLESEYSRKVQSAIRDLHLPVSEIRYELILSSTYRTKPPVLVQNGNNGTQGLEFPAAANQLNPRLTFSAFVVGSCNQFAHAASLAVASSPSRSYNPLFVYGGSGMGKTHLMHAVGCELIERFPGMRVVYTSG
ncbi:MAG TPA: DnaA/Hda family protein, partial [Nitrospiraceae bacterium]|nr:DnaA/Hda family protein [Nitrospiraceae bacterium]